MTKKRPAVAGRKIWDLSPLFAGDDDPAIAAEQRRIETETKRFVRRWRPRRDYLRDAGALRKALDAYERWKGRCGTDGSAGYYLWLRTQQDLNDSVLRARFNLIDDFSRKIDNEMQFFYLRLARIPLRLQRTFLAHPALQRYRHFLDRIFAESRHLLSEPEERVLTLKAATANAGWIRMVSGFLAKEERPVLLESGRTAVRPLAEIGSLMNSQKAKVRDSAAQAFNGIMARHADAAEAELNAILQDRKTDDELRGFTRPDASRHLADDVESGVVDGLTEAVADRFDISAEFYRLKAALLGVKRLKYHERNVDYGDIKARFSFSESCRLVETVLDRLDRSFASIFRLYLSNGQIDAFPRRGKASGAFCVHHLPSHPTYILLNHTDRLHDVLTLAHEVGHGINNELVRQRQHALHFGTSVCTAEVASTFMEDFVLAEILRQSNEEGRLAILMMKLNDDISTIFRQVACYRFEQELHAAFRERGYLSARDIGALFQRHMAAYMGRYIEQSPGSETWWVYWSHIRHYFYVYSYASGLLISKALQRRVKENAGFITEVKDFLSSGLSASPRAAFARLGIDITDRRFWDNGLDEIAALLEETRALARRLGRLR